MYPGTDRSEPVAERYEITGSIIQQAVRANDLLKLQCNIIYDKTNAKPNQRKYPERAVKEAVVNAIVHRDYEIQEPNRITVFSDRIEIKSVGTLHWGVNRENFKKGKASAKWRNQTFAYLFNKLHLSQSEGQGIPTILRLMAEEGCPVPVFEIEEDSVTCILPAHPRHTLIAKDVPVRER
jgi:predicted HTH transcriptional regulator